MRVAILNEHPGAQGGAVMKNPVRWLLLILAVVVAIVVALSVIRSRETSPTAGRTYRETAGRAPATNLPQAPMAVAPAGMPMQAEKDQAAREMLANAHAQRGGAPAAVGGAEGGANKVPPALPRKIIFNAQVDLIVEDFDAAATRLKALVKAQQGFIFKEDVQGSKGTQRSGNWIIKVPAEHFELFLSLVGDIGELQRSHSDSQDVSERFYDLTARVKNKKAEEDRLNRHLDKSTGNLQEILVVEREIARVREEIEQMETQLNDLTRLTSLSTVTVTMQSRSAYVPPVTLAAPTFRARLDETWASSVGLLTGFGQTVMLIAVAFTPWLVVLAPAAGVVWLLRRRRPARDVAPHQAV